MKRSRTFREMLFGTKPREKRSTSEGNYSPPPPTPATECGKVMLLVVSVSRGGGYADLDVFKLVHLGTPFPAPSCSPAQMGKPEPNLAPQDMFTWTSPYNHTFSNSIEFNIYHPRMRVGNVFSRFCLCVCLFRL